MSRFIRWRGLTQLERELRKLPDHATDEARGVIDDITEKVLADTKRDAPVSNRTGGVHLRDAAKRKVSKSGLLGRVGFSKRVVGKRLFEKAGWRAHFVLFGTRGGTVLSGPFKGAKIPPLPANDFLGRAIDRHKAEFIRRMKIAIRNAFRKGIS